MYSHLPAVKGLPVLSLVMTTSTNHSKCISFTGAQEHDSGGTKVHTLYNYIQLLYSPIGQTYIADQMPKRPGLISMYSSKHGSLEVELLGIGSLDGVQICTTHMNTHKTSHVTHVISEYVF